MIGVTGQTAVGLAALLNGFNGQVTVVLVVVIGLTASGELSEYLREQATGGSP
jgi:hypothetical protein